MIFDKSDYDKITTIVSLLGAKKMQKSSMGYDPLNPKQTILEAAKKNAANYTSKSKQSPAISLMNVVLAANRNYNLQVVNNINKVKIDYPGLTVKELETLLRTEFRTSEELKKMWGHDDANKHEVLTALVKEIRIMDKTSTSIESDYEVMRKWAKSVSVKDWENSSISRIKGIGLATFQHLRMTFGVNTVKPDKRVKEVLQKAFECFNLSTTGKNTILAVEEIAKITGYKVLQIDQIFVKYGSGYYIKDNSAEC